VSQEEALQGEPGPDESSLSGAGSPSGGAPSARRRGSVAIGVLEYVAGQIVDDPSAIRVDVEEGRGGVTLRLHVAPDDMGKVIGKRGRVAQSIRTLVRAAGAREGIGVNVDIVD
jgi:predicted RNA-binding protein YlqC (UPF0109 family)